MLTFVLPPAAGVVSGGHLYNERVLAALREAGRPVRVCALQEWRESTASTALTGPSLVDTIYLAELGPEDFARGPLHLLVHHLESLAPEDGRAGDRVFVEDEQDALRQFAGFIVTSEFTADYLVSRGFHRDSVVVAPPGSRFLPKDSSAAAPRGGPLRALVVANLVPRKRVVELLEELSVAGPAVEGLRLRVVGGEDLDPVCAARCRSFAAAAPLQGIVELVGQVAPDRMAEEYRWASLLISAAAMETFGMALQEAAAAGVPIFAVDAGYAGAHVNEGVSGRLFADVPDLVAGVLAHAADDAARRRLQEGALERKTEGAIDWSETATSLWKGLER